MFNPTNPLYFCPMKFLVHFPEDTPVPWNVCWTWRLLHNQTHTHTRTRALTHARARVCNPILGRLRQGNWYKSHTVLSSGPVWAAEPYVCTKQQKSSLFGYDSVIRLFEESHDCSHSPKANTDVASLFIEQYLWNAY